MNATLAIAKATVIEARRNRVAWSLLFFCLVMVLTSFVFQEVTIAAFDRIVRDVGIAAITLFSVLLGTFLGIGVVGRDIDRRIVYVIAAKPLSRFQYLLGRALGVWLTVALSLGLMTGAFLLECLLYRGPIHPVIFEGLLLLLAEIFMLVCVAVLAASSMGSLIAAFVTLSTYVIGHFSEEIYFAGRRSQVEAVRYGAAALYYALPNLERFNLKSEISTLAAVPLSRIVGGVAYGAVYSAIFLIVAAVLFERRDLK